MLQKSLLSVVFLTIITVSGFAQDNLSSKRSSLPTFENSKNLLPVPIIESEPAWIDMYWFCWKEAFNKLKEPAPNSPFVANFIDEAFGPQIFQWDTHFMIQFWKYAHHIFPSIESHDNFYVCQDKDGYICREIREEDGSFFFFRGKDNTINPPLFTWVEYDYYNITGDDSRFSKVIPVQEKYLNWIEHNRKLGGQHNLYWQTNLGSGMDNSPRTGTAWVDMSAQMSLSYKYLSKMSEHVGDSLNAVKYSIKAKEISDNINKWMWNEKDGLYYDIHDMGEQYPVKTSACFWPLLSKTATEDQASRLIENLKDTTSFWRQIPFPTLAADEPAYRPVDGYWLGSVWAPTNYMIIRGLHNYGYDDFAYKASVKFLRGMEKIFKQTGTVWENYNPDKYEESKRAHPDFVGWTGLGPIAILIESVLGIKADVPSNTITWDIKRVDNHGIKNLHVGNKIVSLFFKPSVINENEVEISAKTNEPINLNINFNGRQKILKLVEVNKEIKIKF